jgi:hypothetical protein
MMAFMTTVNPKFQSEGVVTGAHRIADTAVIIKRATNVYSISRSLVIGPVMWGAGSTIKSLLAGSFEDPFVILTSSPVDEDVYLRGDVLNFFGQNRNSRILDNTT